VDVSGEMESMALEGSEGNVRHPPSSAASDATSRTDDPFDSSFAAVIPDESA
jgi:hypothetical protein